ncbi:hypothetical protein M2207_002710 [Bradyrhizobium japonicum]|uniref:hypothetical protein n=1 Tax=Bradyrhizobium japonicum TaxID=375 RepID=UPI002167B059|nr:hypothetical protein [Bradyrhizobium japonicum]MCS3497487.1 hypothetical protein [Bradyrhizobium japonicum]MCS4002105.1 hypothetical protein [Bradyrhizobium japonicum]
MYSILSNVALVTPHYVTGREFTRRLKAASHDEVAILQIALDLHAGRLVVTASKKYTKRLDAFVATATRAVSAAARHLN